MPSECRERCARVDGNLHCRTRAAAGLAAGPSVLLILPQGGDSKTHLSETLMDHFQSPRHEGCMEAPDCVGTAGTPWQGRFIFHYLRTGDGRVERAQFECNGCGVTVAVCSVLTEMVEGRPFAECLALRAADITEALEGLPPHKADCAHFGIIALRSALDK